MASNRVHVKIGPSILNSDLSRLAEECNRLVDAGADYLHLDVMDGMFVPNITFGHPLVKCLRKNVPNTVFETHMMVQNPEQWVESMADAGANMYTFHVEPCKNIPTICAKIKEAGMQVGLAIKPNTKVSEIEKFIDLADVILVMTVEPGFGGQKFMKNMMEKVEFLRTNYPLLNIEVDGGVDLNTIADCAEAGANVIVSGTAVTGSTDPKSVISQLRDTTFNTFLTKWSRSVQS